MPEVNPLSARVSLDEGSRQQSLKLSLAEKAIFEKPIFSKALDGKDKEHVVALFLVVHISLARAFCFLLV